MKHRTWIFEALLLHFEEHLSRVKAGRRLGIPRTTVCELFVRFREAGLVWPLSSGMSEQELDARLYRPLSAVPTVVPEATVMPEMPAVRKRIRRPNFPRELKIALVERSLQPGANVAQLAREHNINITCCSTGAGFTGRACCYPTMMSQHCFPSHYHRSRIKAFLFRPVPGQKTCRVKHCAASCYFLPVPCA